MKKLDINGGYFYAPTVLADLDDKAQCVADEVFGPVLTVQPFDSEEALLSYTRSKSVVIALDRIEPRHYRSRLEYGRIP